MLTRHIVPCLSLQSQGYEVGLNEELRKLVKDAQHIAASESRATVEWFPTGPWFENDANSPKVHGYCSACMKLVEIAAVNRRCICEFKKS